MINLMDAIQLKSFTLEYKVSCQIVKYLNKDAHIHLNSWLLV